MNLLVLCCAALVLLYAVLGVNAMRVQRLKRLKPETTDFKLHQAVLAYANASEYVPLLVASLLYLSYFSHDLLAPLGILATLSRIAYAVGVLTTRRAEDRSRLTMLGSVGTYACLFGIVVVFVRLGVVSQ